jgi:glycosyltransferase involved in cell wall biosynthesis
MLETRPPPLAPDAPVSLILLAYQAGALLVPLLAEWTRCLESVGRDYEILWVDDGSPDDSAAQATALVSVYPRLRVLCHKQRRGYGAALRTGIAAARHAVLITATADRQYAPSDLSRLFPLITQVDVVVGCRRQPLPVWLRWGQGLWRLGGRLLLGAAPAPAPTWLGWRSAPRRWLARWLFGVRLHDPLCPFRLYRRTLFRRLPLQSDGPFALVEVLAKANFLGAWLAEEAISYQPDPAASAEDQAGPSFWREAWRVFRDPDFGPPFLPETSCSSFSAAGAGPERSLDLGSLP